MQADDLRDDFGPLTERKKQHIISTINEYRLECARRIEDERFTQEEEMRTQQLQDAPRVQELPEEHGGITHHLRVLNQKNQNLLFYTPHDTHITSLQEILIINR